MKKLIAFTALIALSLVAHADISMPKEDTLIDKLGRGLGNVVGAPGEIIDSYLEVSNNEGGIPGMTKGVIQGLSRAGSDFGLGLYDIVTGPLPVGPYYSYQTWKQPPHGSSLVREYPPSDLGFDYFF